MILDPADPTWDVGNGAAWHWDLLAREAESCYEHPCFLQAAGGAVQPWEGPVSEGLPGSLLRTQFVYSVFPEHLLCAGALGCGTGLKSGGCRHVTQPDHQAEPAWRNLSGGAVIICLPRCVRAAPGTFL